MNFSISGASRALLIAIMIGMVAIVSAMAVYYRAEANVKNAMDARYQAYLLADELRQSSDDLTRLARTYVITADARYETQYFDILAIRNGKKPRPEAYHRIYWDFVAATDEKPRPDGVQRSLSDLMKDAGFTEEEFAFLEEAQANSDGLVGLEVQAMNAVKGKFANDAGEYTVEAAPDFELARDLMHSRLYHEYKAEIMQPVDMFYIAVEERTTAAIHSAETYSSIAWFTLIGVIGSFVVLMLLASVHALRNVSAPLSRLQDIMDRLTGGDLTVDVDGKERGDEIGAMARAVDQFREDGIRMQKLTREKEEAATEERARQEVLRRLQSEVARVVQMAVDGDLTGRITDEFDNPDFAALAGGVNQLVGSVDTGVGEVVRVMHELSNGNLTTRMDGQFVGAFAELKSNVNDTVSRLENLVSQISGSFGRVNSGAKEISSSAEELNHRTMQQASSLEETSATMEEISVSIKSNADNSTSAQSLASDASGRAVSGGAIVEKAITAMNVIEAEAKKISDIISVIDGIAFQTNLLALNAAVEAARAGDAGKGFAVVASEVRALAQRSSDAARDIRVLIETSASQVSEGVDLVTNTGEALNGIVESIAQVEDSIRSIASASQQQASGVLEITSTISQMDQMTQQNTVLVESSAERAQAVTASTAEVNDLVSYFKVGSGADAVTGGTTTRAA